MKKILLILTFFVLTISVKAQFSKPTGAVTIPTYSFFRNPADSSITIYQGSVNLYNTFLMKWDSVKVKGYFTNYKILQYRKLNNHDSLSALDERKYQSLTDTVTWGLGLSQSGHVTKVDTSSASILSRQRALHEYALISHNQGISTIIGLLDSLNNHYTKAQTNTLLAGKQPLATVLTNIQDTLNLHEHLANKSTTTTLGTSNILYSTQNAVKTYIDTHAGLTTTAHGLGASAFHADNFFQTALTNPYTGTGAAGQVTFHTGTSTLSGDNGLFWDNTNKWLGLGTISPGGIFDVVYSAYGGIRFDLTAATSTIKLTNHATQYGFLKYDINDNHLELGTYGTERVRVNATGVGVGIDPAYKMDVIGAGTTQLRVGSGAGGSGYYAGIRLCNYDATQNADILFTLGGDNSLTLQTNGDYTGNAIIFKPGGVERFRVIQSGAATFTGSIISPTINLTTGAAVGKAWLCTNATTGAGNWATFTTTQTFISTWNASTNNPTLVDGDAGAVSGYYHNVTTAGTQTFGGVAIAFEVGDAVIYNGSIWQRLPKPVITGAALTKTDDTNITLALGGSPSTALLNATSITAGWTGTLADSRIASAATWNAKLAVSDTTSLLFSKERAAKVSSYPTLNQSTTGNAATATNLTGLTTSVATLNAQSGTNTGDQALTIAGTTSPTIALSGSNTATFSAGTGITLGQSAGTITVTNSSPSSGGTVTSVAALTLGTAGTGLNSSVATGTTTPVITLNVPSAGTASVTAGTISKAEYDTFNAKQAALVSTTNIKSVNGTTLLGSGDLSTTQTTVSGNAGTVTVAANTTNATYYPLFSTSATGSLAPQTTAARLTFNPSTGNLMASIFQLSDKRYKNHIKPLDRDDFWKIGQIDFYKCFMNDDPSNLQHYVVLAQEVKKILPELVDSSNPDKLIVNYQELLLLKVAQLEQVIKEQGRRIEKLEKKNRWKAQQLIIQ